MLNSRSLVRFIAASATAALLSGCMSTGRVLHIENRGAVPYNAVDVKLKLRVVHALVRHRLITRAQQLTCMLNIMEIDGYYVVDVWPDGAASSERFGVRLTKPFLSPAGKYADCTSASEADSCRPVSRSGSAKK